MAVENGDSEIIQLLLSSHRADLDLTDKVNLIFLNNVLIWISWFIFGLFMEKANWINAKWWNQNNVW